MTQFFFVIALTLSLMLVPLAAVMVIMIPGFYWLSMVVGFAGIISTGLMLALYDE